MPLPPDIQTSTINELPGFKTYVSDLTIADKIPLWLSSVNKTVWCTVADLRTLIETNGGGSITPIIQGDKIIHDVTLAEDGGTIVSIPDIKGKTFFLWRDGRPMGTSEYVILNEGGFQITIPGDVLLQGQRFLLEVYELQGGSSVGANKSSLFKGEVNVPTNMSFDVVNHVNKLIKLRGNNTAITFTLPLVSDLEDNTFIVIEATINNNVEQKITTQGGQFIYFNNTSKNAVYLRPGNVIWLFRGTDGYYVINEFGRVYEDIGLPKAAFKVGLNQLLCKGQLLNRADYPRLWEWVQTLGFSLVSDGVWNTASATDANGKTVPNPYRSCFSTGNGSTTFRLPDLMNMFLRGVLSEAGSDPNRILNSAGGRQVEDTHLTVDDMGGQDNVNNTGTNTALGYSGGDPGNTQFKNRTHTYGTETRPYNAGVLWVINC